MVEIVDTWGGDGSRVGVLGGGCGCHEWCGLVMLGEADGNVGSWELVVDGLVGAVGVWW